MAALLRQPGFTSFKSDLFFSTVHLWFPCSNLSSLLKILTSCTSLKCTYIDLVYLLETLLMGYFLLFLFLAIFLLLQCLAPYQSKGQHNNNHLQVLWSYGWDLKRTQKIAIGYLRNSMKWEFPFMINRQGSPRLLLVNNLSQEIEKSLKCTTSTIEPNEIQILAIGSTVKLRY